MANHVKRLREAEFQFLDPKHQWAAEKLAEIASDVAKQSSARSVKFLKHLKWRVIASRSFQDSPVLAKLSHLQVERILGHLVFSGRVSGFSFETGQLGVSARQLDSVEEVVSKWLSGGRKENVGQLAQSAKVNENSLRTFLLRSGLLETRKA